MTDDDVFAQMMAGVELEPPAEEEVEDFSKLTDLEVVERFQQVRRALYERAEMLHPTTDEARALHSQRSALLIQMSQRGLR